MPLHQQAISKVMISFDLHFIFSASEDGSFIVQEIHPFVNGEEQNQDLMVKDSEKGAFATNNLYGLNPLVLTSSNA